MRNATNSDRFEENRLKKHLLIGKVLGVESFRVAPRKFVTYIHVKVLLTTDVNTNGFTQIQCKLNLSQKVKHLNLKDNNHVYVEFNDYNESIHDGRSRITVKALDVSRANSNHFKLIKEEVQTC